jgi:hypothetical protein
MQLATQSGVQGDKRMMQPPAACRSHSVSPGAFIIKNEYRHDPPMRSRRNQRRVVRKAQILSEPANRYGGAHSAILYRDGGAHIT